MALCPFATHRLIPPGANDPRITPRVAVLHVDAGDNPSLYDYFRTRSGGVESHFHVRKDGGIDQYRDTDWEADANHRANPFAVSIETQGRGEGEWTPEQLASIKRLLLWLNSVHPAIRLQKCPTWDGAGVGYHVQFGAPGAWTPVAKSCPGPDRVRQFHNVIVPWLESGAEQEDEMPTTDEIVDALLARKIKVKRGGKGDAIELPVEQVLRETFQRAERVDVDKMAKAVAANLGGVVGAGVSIEALEAAAAVGVRTALREGVGE